MRKYLTALLLVGPILLISILCCTPSLHPLYTDDDLVFEPALLGIWVGVDQAKDERASWEFVANRSTTADPLTGEEVTRQFYTLYHTVGNSRTAQFTAHLLRLEDKLFLDLYPEREDDPSADWFHETYFVPTHSFWYVAQLEPQLFLAYIDPDWLDAFLVENPGAIAHEFVGEADDQWAVYSAPTEDLQEFILSCLGQDGAITAESTIVLERADGATVQELGRAPAEMSVIATLDGKPQGVAVQLWDAEGMLVKEEFTDWHGIGYLKQIPPGTYTVKFVDMNGVYYPAERIVSLRPDESLPVVVELSEDAESATAEQPLQDSGDGVDS